MATFGGTDNGRLSGPVAEGILALNNEVVVDVVISPFCVADNRFDELTKKYMGRLLVHSDADIVSLMQRCTIIVGAAGFTIIEALAAGLTPVVCSITDNQKLNIKELQSMADPQTHGPASPKFPDEPIKRLLSRTKPDPITRSRLLWRHSSRGCRTY